jgi:hypothetical protein
MEVFCTFFYYCPPQGMGENASPLGEDFSSIFLPQGFKGSGVQG